VSAARRDARAGGHRRLTLDDTVRLLAGEVADPRLATTTVLDRLVDVLLIQLLRAWVRTEPAGPSVSWLRALRDPIIASGERQPHREPARGRGADGRVEVDGTDLQPDEARRAVDPGPSDWDARRRRRRALRKPGLKLGHGEFAV
jgi:hypothetical protein